VKIKEMDALNTSDHTLVLATVGVDIKRATPKAAKILTKPRWGKCNHDTYKGCIQNDINNLENSQFEICTSHCDGKRLAALDGCLLVLTHFHV
jgi:hypothetical protein